MKIKCDIKIEKKGKKKLEDVINQSRHGWTNVRVLIRIMSEFYMALEKKIY